MQVSELIDLIPDGHGSHCLLFSFPIARDPQSVFFFKHSVLDNEEKVPN